MTYDPDADLSLELTAADLGQELDEVCPIHTQKHPPASLAAVGHRADFIRAFTKYSIRLLTTDPSAFSHCEPCHVRSPSSILSPLEDEQPPSTSGPTLPKLKLPKAPPPPGLSPSRKDGRRRTDGDCWSGSSPKARTLAPGRPRSREARPSSSSSKAPGRSPRASVPAEKFRKSRLGASAEGVVGPARSTRKALPFPPPAPAAEAAPSPQRAARALVPALPFPEPAPPTPEGSPALQGPRKGAVAGLLEPIRSEAALAGLHGGALSDRADLEASAALTDRTDRSEPLPGHRDWEAAAARDAALGWRDRRALGCSWSKSEAASPAGAPDPGPSSLDPGPGRVRGATWAGGARTAWAAGSLAVLEQAELACSVAVDRDFGRLPAAAAGDWLAEHPEHGQTVAQFIKKSAKKKYKPHPATANAIYLQPLGSVSLKEAPAKHRQILKKGSPFLHYLRTFLEAWFLGMEVKVLAYQRLEVTGRVNPQSPGGYQVHAGEIIHQHLRAVRRPLQDAYALVGVTMEDLYPRDTWGFAFGLADMISRNGVFSFARYDDATVEGQGDMLARWEQNLLALGAARGGRGRGQATGRAREEKRIARSARLQPARLLKRAVKVMGHELCHCFGLKHCIFFNCVMQGSNNVAENSTKFHDLCPVCLRKAFFAVEFDVVERYRKLKAWVDDLIATNPDLLAEEDRAAASAEAREDHKDLQQEFAKWTSSLREGLGDPEGLRAVSEHPSTTGTRGRSVERETKKDRDDWNPYQQIFGEWSEWYQRRIDTITQATGTRKLEPFLSRILCSDDDQVEKPA